MPLIKDMNKTHQDRLSDVCFICRKKAGPRKISISMKEYVKKNILPSFEEYESILPNGICERCRRNLGEILVHGEDSKYKLPPNDLPEMVELLKNLPPITRSSICKCFCCEISKSPDPKGNTRGRPSPIKPLEGVVKNKIKCLPKSRPDRVKTLFEGLSPKTRDALALKIIKDKKSNDPSSSIIHLQNPTGVPVPMVFGKKDVEKINKPQIPYSEIFDVQDDQDYSNNEMNKYLKDIRKNLGNRSIQPGAEKAVQKNSSVIEEFFTTKSFQFEITDPDDKKNTILVEKIGVICEDVENLKKSIDEKRSFNI